MKSRHLAFALVTLLAPVVWAQDAEKQDAEKQNVAKQQVKDRSGASEKRKEQLERRAARRGAGGEREQELDAQEKERLQQVRMERKARAGGAHKAPGTPPAVNDVGTSDVGARDVVSVDPPLQEKQTTPPAGQQRDRATDESGDPSRASSEKAAPQLPERDVRKIADPAQARDVKVDLPKDREGVLKKLTLEERKHRERLAKIARLRELARAKEQTERLGVLEQLERKENERFELWRSRARETLGERDFIEVDRKLGHGRRPGSVHDVRGVHDVRDVRDNRDQSDRDRPPDDRSNRDRPNQDQPNRDRPSGDRPKDG